MTYQLTVFALPPFLAGVLLMVLGGYAIAHWRQRGARPFAMLTAAAGFWCFGYSLELSAVTLEAKVFWAQFQYIGAYLTPVAWLLLAARFSGIRPFRQVMRTSILLIVPAVSIVLAFTNESHHLIWETASLGESNGFQALVVTRGWWYPIGITYCYVLMAAGIAVLARVALRTHSLLREQAWTLIGAALIPWFSNMVYMVSSEQDLRYDVTPLGFAVACTVIAFGLFRFGMFDLVPIARDAVVDQMADSILVLDQQGRIVDANDEARRLTGRSMAALSGLRIEDIFDQWPEATGDDAHSGKSRIELTLQAEDNRSFEVRLSQLYGNFGLSIGQVIVLRDVSSKKRTQEALRNANQQLATRVSELERRNREISLLAQFGGQLLSATDFDDLAKIVVDFARRIFPDDPGRFFIVSPGEDIGRPIARWGAWQHSLPAQEADGACWQQTVQAELSVQLAADLTGPDRDGNDWFHLSAPMMQNGVRLGALAIYSQDSQALAEKKLLLLAVAEGVSLALSALRLRERLYSESIRDPLTGLYNRRYLDEILERELRRAERSGRPAGIIMADIDHFKRFNDTHGHQAGDAVLRAIGSFLLAHTRSSDVACRYGGEEFTIVLPDSTAEETESTAERLLEDFRNFEVTIDGQTLSGITISIGIATFPVNGQTAMEMVQAADEALYAAKREGRDRLAVSTCRRLSLRK